MSIALIHLVRFRRLRALRHLHREGLEMRNVFVLAPEPGSERLPHGAQPSAIASDDEHVKVVRMIR